MDVLGFKGNNIIFSRMEVDVYKTKKEEPLKYANFSRLPNEMYIERHNFGIQSNKDEISYFGYNPFNELYTLNIDHYFPEGYNILPCYKEVNLESLSLGEINYNKYIILKIVAKLYQRRAILFLGEDNKKNILKISIYNYSNYYNTNKEEELQKIFDIGKYIICINSFYKVYIPDDGLRIESPAEIILLDNLNELNYFLDKNNNRNIKNLKELGNFFMQKKTYEKAIYYYLESLKLIDENDFEDKEEMNIIVISNLIEAYLKYEYYTNALLYSNKGFELLKKYNEKIKVEQKINDKIESQKQKILYRKIRALKGLRQFAKIYELLNKKLPKNFRKNKLKIFDILYKEYESNVRINDIMSNEELNNILKLQEFQNILIDVDNKICNENGNYNFYKMIQMEKNNSYLDFADYYSNKIYIDYDNQKGIFLRANDFIHKGELIIVEKAIISISQNYKDYLNQKFNTNLGNKSELEDSLEDDILSYNYLLESFKKYPNDYKKLLLLYDVENGNKNINERFAKINRKITQEELTNIIIKNRHTTRRFIYYAKKISKSLFFIPSFFNHSCDSNIQYEGIGDFIICFAIKDIHKGDELTITYIEPRLNYIKRKEKLLNWGIQCECNLCKYELKEKNEGYRIKLNQYIDFFQSYHYKANINEENFKYIFGKINEISSFMSEYNNKLSSYEKCLCLSFIVNFYTFISNVDNVQLIKEQFFRIEKFNYFFLSLEFFNVILRFNRHLIDMNSKDCHKLYNDSLNDLIVYLKKMTPYDEESIKEILELNIKQLKIDYNK